MMSQPVIVNNNLASQAKEILNILKSIRQIDFTVDGNVPSTSSTNQDVLSHISQLKASLLASKHTKEAQVFGEIHDQFSLPAENPSSGWSPQLNSAESRNEEIIFTLKSQLMSLNSQDASYIPRSLTSSSTRKSRPMTLSEKILAHHSTQPLSTIAPGDVITMHVDWIMASELSWHGMSGVYNELLKSQPTTEKKSSAKIFRNDRFWLAGDHLVTSQNKHKKPYSTFVTSAERARKDFNMTEYQGMNYTIMHTEFVRSRALPGQLVIGSDSHTCSAGAVGSLAIGLGTSDVVMPLITGQTWIKVPESIRIDFVGKPPVGIGGKDVILHILGELGRNTVAKERIVEFSGSGARCLSTDARFAICNMCTEFGAVTGLFVPDGQTIDYLQGRKRRRDREGAIYFKPDADAHYAQTFKIDLSQIQSTVAKYPKPDDVVPVDQMAGLGLDGCFIGACTTAEEDLILAALALEVGLNKGLNVVSHGKRKVVPGSVPIREKLDQLNLTEIYKKAGFEVGEPSCSYCVGLSEDKAAEGEVWLSSQNRNFENRMGPGSIGHITSALVVAASSFNMTITDPKDLIESIPSSRLEKCGLSLDVLKDGPEPDYMEPSMDEESNQSSTTESETTSTTVSELPSKDAPSSANISKASIQVLPAFIDTDALAPNESLATCKTESEFAEYCLKYTHPNFRQKAKDGANIVVAGEAFGVGSSREVAVTALLGCGIKVVIAPSFSFILGRNAANLGLLCISLEQESGLYDFVGNGEDVEIEIDMNQSIIKVHKNGEIKSFPFKLSNMERQLVERGGMSNLWKLHGTELWNNMTRGSQGSKVSSSSSLPASQIPSLELKNGEKSQELAW